MEEVHLPSSSCHLWEIGFRNIINHTQTGQHAHDTEKPQQESIVTAKDRKARVRSAAELCWAFDINELANAKIAAN